MLGFTDYEARSFDCGEYAFAQEGTLWEVGDRGAFERMATWVVSGNLVGKTIFAGYA